MCQEIQDQIKLIKEGGGNVNGGAGGAGAKIGGAEAVNKWESENLIEKSNNIVELIE